MHLYNKFDEYCLSPNIATLLTNIYLFPHKQNPSLLCCASMICHFQYNLQTIMTKGKID